MARADLKMNMADLERFVRRVGEMKEEGLKTWAIADALGVPKSTINGRLRRWKQRGVA
jgi:transposase